MAADPHPAPTQIELQGLQRHYRDQARIAALESALSGCLHYIAALNGIPCDDPEPECSIDAKRLLGWRLG